MRVGLSNHYESLSTGNYCFRVPDAPIGDELLLPFVRLAEKGRVRGVEFMTLDMAGDLEALDAIIFVDYPASTSVHGTHALAAKIPKYLITFECPVILPANWVPALHSQFKKVFTWSDMHVSAGGIYTKINFAQDLNHPIVPTVQDKKLACLVASNKDANHAQELYTARRSVISWFEKNAPDDFDFFGPGWPSSRCYNGTTISKRIKLTRYKFNICYENARGYPGYITEKIFDAFLAGCIPVYLGAPNILKYIPSDCFIDRRLFGNERELHAFLKEMPASRIEVYKDNIRNFLRSAAAFPFTCDHFADTILREIAP